MTNFKDSLEEILKRHKLLYVEEGSITTDQATQSIIDLIDKEIIGEDEDYGDARIEKYKIPEGVKWLDVPRVDFMTRNKLRTEQRAKLEELFKETT